MVSAEWPRRDGGILIAQHPCIVLSRQPHTVGRVVIFGPSGFWPEGKNFLNGASVIFGHFPAGQRVDPAAADSDGCAIPASAPRFVKVQHDLPKYRSCSRYSGYASHRRVVGIANPDANGPFWRKTDRPIVPIVRAGPGLTCDWKIKAQIRVQSKCGRARVVITEHIRQEISRTLVKDPMTGCNELCQFTLRVQEKTKWSISPEPG